MSVIKNQNKRLESKDMKITLISTTTSEDQGIRTLSSVLKKEGYGVNLVFMPLNKGYYSLYDKKILEQLKNICIDSKLIGVSCFINTKSKAVQIMNFLKRNTKATIIFGGIHVTLAPDECIKDNDILCIGEGEYAILDIAKAVNSNKTLDKIPNLWIKNKETGKIIKNPVRNLIDNLDELPYPDFDFENHYILDKDKIRKFKEEDLCKEILFLSGRGCPHSCDYCSNSTYNELYCGKRKRIIRYHSNDYIIDFLKQIKEKFRSLIYIALWDDTFSLRSLDEIKDFSYKYKKSIGIKLKIQIDARTITDEKVKYLIDSGCSYVSLGIQGSERVNKEIYHRYISEENILRTADILSKYTDKIIISYDIIATNPYESEQDILNLINLIIKLPKPFKLYTSNLIFFVGSKLYNKAVEDRTIKSVKDTGLDLIYEARGQHILLKKKNIYLNSILNLMRGYTTNDKYGGLSKKQLDFLLKKKLIRFFNDNSSHTYIVPYSLMFFDFIKYNFIKPVYLKMPQSIKKLAGKRVEFG